MIHINQKSDCCGCRACEQICPKSCISISPDECGFQYPHINKDICLECGLCEKVCPFLNFTTDKNAERHVYAMSHKDQDIIENSSSGGAFYGIYNWGIKHGYKVYGVAFDEKFCAVYKSATDMDGCVSFRRSKYIQTNPAQLYSKIKSELHNGERIIFSGTPCFVKGLRNFLRKDFEQLITIDLICHGIPSPVVWMKYLRFLEDKYKGKIVDVNMRDKRLGWCHRSLTSVKVDSKGDVCDTSASNTYMNGFGQDIFYRPSCYNCKFSNMDRPGDLTIADFWDINKYTNKFEGKRGVSCCISNTQKGNEIICHIRDNFLFEERKKEECLQPNLMRPTAINKQTEQFWRDWVNSNGNFEYIAKLYFGYDYKSRIKKKIIRVCSFLGGIKRKIRL